VKERGMTYAPHHARTVSPNEEWLAHVQPTGLVAAAKVLDDIGARPLGQTAIDTDQAREALETRDVRAKSVGPYIADPWGFVATVLGWDARFVAGAPGGPPLPDNAMAELRDQGLSLRPDWVVTARSGDPTPDAWQLFVRLLGPEIDLDRRGAIEGWDASASQQMERLLRETGAPAGLLIGGVAREREHARPRPVLRLITAPKGETSGWMDFPVLGLTETAGRPMLGGLKLLLGAAALYTAAREHRLPALIEETRKAQANVSSDLAAQVLGALHALLRGLAAPTAMDHRIKALARDDPHHLYEGLLTVLMRLVFLLYAEDRDLLPAQRSGPGLQLYEENYSVRGLLAKLEDDEARYPATMDDRVGGWGRLLALFRLVHEGDRHGWIQPRGGKLFDPEAFAFLESRSDRGAAPRVARVSDACVLKVLRGLMRLNGERLSYRTLDVEQIGSVYETVMGFTVEVASGPSLAIKAGKRDRTPVFVNLETLAATKPGDRLRWLKDNTDRGKFPATIEAAIKAARSADDLAAAFETSARGGVVDERASPGKRLIPAGTPLLQPTDERRRTGSHYTPRSLTEPIVLHALEPALERLGCDATAEQILDLKVCDLAMGSGAFLVEACRQLGARLEEAWRRWPHTKPTIPVDEDETLHARRLVAQKCIYGVDRNPMATDLARLSLWLATLARDHEFTFLDHALKSGDSLVGLTTRKIMSLSWMEGDATLELTSVHVRERLREAETLRERIRRAPDFMTQADLAPIHARAEAKIAEVRLLGDAVVAAFFGANKDRIRKDALGAVRDRTLSGENWRETLKPLADQLVVGEHPIRPFHWEVEFPEVFDRKIAGFDAIVGNPPFMGGKRISGELGEGFLHWLLSTHEESDGNADLIAHFFRRSHELLRESGCFGLIATNTIRQGDTRTSSLLPIILAGSSIYRAVRRLPWPGEAAVVVSVVHVRKRDVWPALLDGRPSARISSYLLEGSMDSNPSTLKDNLNIAFNGTKIYGQGFCFDDEDEDATPLSEMRVICEARPSSLGLIKPYMGGEELNNSPETKPHRFVIDFGEMNLIQAQQFPELLDIITRKVRPERERVKDNADGKVLKSHWWRFFRPKRELYDRISHLTGAIITAETSPHLSFAKVPIGMIFSHALKIVADDSLSRFTVLQSRQHELWAWTFASTLEDRLRYTPSDVFETFPFPEEFETNTYLEDAGHAYHDHRAALMIQANEGLTKTYNRFHDPDETRPAILELRQLHDTMDHAVLVAYGWNDLIPRAVPKFEPLFEEDEDDTPAGKRARKKYRYRWPEDIRDEVLARLLALNAERAAAEHQAAGGKTPVGKRGASRKGGNREVGAIDGIAEDPGPLFLLS
jgi:hypothetical protein